MVTGAQALTDLNGLIIGLTNAIKNVTDEFAVLLSDISAANGVDPAKVEAAVQQGQSLLANLQSTIDNVKKQANPPQPISVSVSPSTASLAPGATQSFSASVANDPANAGVTWSVATGGAGGTVDQSGNYTAPATTGTDTVTATSQGDTSKTASASVTIA